jgi:uncharacterized membrane protein YkvA (DUF1232 family)
MSKPRGFEKDFSDDGFWAKAAKFAKSAGAEVIEGALKLYYAAQTPETPKWAKAVIYGALGYFISPIDAIPDLIPAAGYTDDLGVLAAALATCAMYITDEVKAKAAHKMTAWFGE